MVIKGIRLISMQNRPELVNVQAENEVPVKMGDTFECYKELRPIGVWTTICHREKTRPTMIQFEVLICK